MATSPLVIDNGSGVIKAGFAGDDYPQCVFSNIVGQTKYVKCMAGAMEGYHVGDNVQKHRGLLKLTYPIDHGTVADWDGMERIWSHLYSKLGVMSEEHMVLMTEAPHTPAKMKEKTAEIFFETFNVPAIHFAIQPVLALYASGNKTGVVLDSGDGCTHAVAVYEGYCIPHAMIRINLAGRDVTEHLRLQLRRAGHWFTTSAEFEVVRCIKEQVCYVAYVPAKEEELALKGAYDTVNYKLPDGQTMAVGAERFRAPELLFTPTLIGSECESIQEALVNCIKKTDTDLRKELYSSVHLAGGSTLVTGFGDRLMAEARRIAPKDVKIKIRAQPERKYTTWLGGSILASLAAFKSVCVNRQKYYDEGVRALSSI
eukprot:NODE_2401_length_1187_cov_28.294340_g2287_i0.p1 GENE.NODE_2401_length_1187_cov_28.294340_g2287_i0~~NODE_2401_length_1187_cov_28.294340_g2287_i0.p1  ORF type:complete len:370 (-),score=92.12 NODE_2401_length_1187_cov_28.294340_g2287_i0:25-1134(-)